MELLSANHGTETGEYKIHYFIDYDSDGILAQDSGDAYMTTSVTLAESDTNSPVSVDLINIPLYLSDNDTEWMALFEITEGDTSSMVSVGESAPLIGEIYLYDTAAPAATISNILAGTADETFSITSLDGRMQSIPARNNVLYGIIYPLPLPRCRQFGHSDGRR